MIRSTHASTVKTTRNAVLAIALGVVCALPAAAQTSTGSSTTGATTTPTSVSATTDRRDDRDWGWIGLLGLAGLAGLLRKKDTMDDKRTYSTNPR